MCVENLSGWTEFTFRLKLSSSFGCNQQLIDGVVYTRPEGCANWQRDAAAAAGGSGFYSTPPEDFCWWLLVLLEKVRRPCVGR